MKILSLTHILFFAGFVFFLASCDKGYEVRFANYYIEPMDSVILGNNSVVFTGIGLETTSDYVKIKNGKYKITCISKMKKKFYSSITIPKTGSGKRSIQIDAINSISILED